MDKEKIKNSIRHDLNCRAWLFPGMYDCDCGHDAALSELSKPDDELLKTARAGIHWQETSELLAAQAEALAQALEEAQWGSFDGHDYRCPKCDGIKPDKHLKNRAGEKKGHTDDCFIGQSLASYHSHTPPRKSVPLDVVLRIARLAAMLTEQGRAVIRTTKGDGVTSSILDFEGYELALLKAVVSAAGYEVTK